MVVRYALAAWTVTAVLLALAIGATAALELSATNNTVPELRAESDAYPVTFNVTADCSSLALRQGTSTSPVSVHIKVAQPPEGVATWGSPQPLDYEPCLEGATRSTTQIVIMASLRAGPLAGSLHAFNVSAELSPHPADPASDQASFALQAAPEPSWQLMEFPMLLPPGEFRVDGTVHNTGNIALRIEVQGFVEGRHIRTWPTFEVPPHNATRWQEMLPNVGDDTLVRLVFNATTASNQTLEDEVALLLPATGGPQASLASDARLRVALLGTAAAFASLATACIVVGTWIVRRQSRS